MTRRPTGTPCAQRLTLARQGERQGARERAQLLITNPDMLHRSFLPVHRQFAAFLRGLRHVIVDEGHYYRRALGPGRRLVISHLAAVSKRYT